jgi:F-type H+-transporting ATPase subunit delta
VSDRGHLTSGVHQAARRLVEELARAGGLEGVDKELEAIERSGAPTLPRCEVLSAVELDLGQRAELEDRLRSTYGQSLEVSYRVQPVILGGLIVRMGDQYLDGSVAARLGQLRKSLTGTQ